jgi:hypothetical protein
MHNIVTDKFIGSSLIKCIYYNSYKIKT